MRMPDLLPNLCGLLLCGAVSFSTAAFAEEITYVYEGNGFDTIVDEPVPEGAYTADSAVSIRLTLEAPLAPSLTDEPILPLAYIVSDGRITITETTAGYPDDQEFVVSTNAAGEITSWTIAVTTYRILVFDWEAISSVSNDATALDEASITECTLGGSFCVSTGVDAGSIAANPGTWSTARFEPLTPADGATPCSAPTFTWGAGDNDFFYVFTRFNYEIGGVQSRAFLTTETSYEMPTAWWELLSASGPSHWVVIGINSAAGTLEFGDAWSFTKPFSGPIDPTGVWSWTQDWNCGSSAFTSTLTLDSCGNYSSPAGSGTWDLLGDQITLDSGRNVVFTGTIDASSDFMAGTGTDSNAPGVIACWSAERTPGAGSSVPAAGDARGN